MSGSSPRKTNPDALAAYLNYFATRVILDAANEVTPSYWTRRAEDFAAVGTEACDEIATACRNAAAFTAMFPAFTEAEVRAVLREVA